MLKRKASSSSSKKASAAAKTPVAAAAEAAGDSPPTKDPEEPEGPAAKKPRSFGSKIERFNSAQADGCTGTQYLPIFSLAKNGSDPRLEPHPDTGVPCFTMTTADGKNLVPFPQGKASSKMKIQTPVAPFGFTILDPMDALKWNTGAYAKDAVDVQAKVLVDVPVLFDPSDENAYSSGQPGWNHVMYSCADAACDARSAKMKMFERDAFQSPHGLDPSKPETMDPKKIKKYVDATVGAVNRTGWPHVPCKTTVEAPHAPKDKRVAAALE